MNLTQGVSELFINIWWGSRDREEKTISHRKACAWMSLNKAT